VAGSDFDPQWVSAPFIAQRDLRSHETQSIVNDRIMALLGVRYLLSDKLLPERTPVLGYRLIEGRDLYVYTVPGTNSGMPPAGGTSSPLLADSAFDRTTAVLTTSELPPLVPVSGSGLVVERGSYRNRSGQSRNFFAGPANRIQPLPARGSDYNRRGASTLCEPTWPWPRFCSAPMSRER
jgi:hypothetical protein